MKYDGTSEFQSSNAVMTIAKTAVHSDLPNTGGMSATFPVSPRYAGDTITVNLVAGAYTRPLFSST